MHESLYAKPYNKIPQQVKKEMHYSIPKHLPRRNYQEYIPQTIQNEYIFCYKMQRKKLQGRGCLLCFVLLPIEWTRYLKEVAARKVQHDHGDIIVSSQPPNYLKETKWYGQTNKYLLRRGRNYVKILSCMLPKF
jgi:hypothetical protein